MIHGKRDFMDKFSVLKCLPTLEIARFCLKKTMELYIETLTGMAFELRVSPFETIMSVKAKIQRLEGIPISHQHLIWHSVELEDDFCLQDYNIYCGATLKLVLAMKGGPINTRRIPVEDSALREMAEYMEANREEILDKLPSASNVTLLVYREGDKLNFFRVVDPQPDGTVSPGSETMYSPVCNTQDDDEEEDEDSPNEKLEENCKMKEKMDQLRVNMEKISLTKRKKQEKNVSNGSRLPRLSSRTHSANQSLNKNFRLPPVGILCPQLADSSGAASSGYPLALDRLSQIAAASAHTPPFVASKTSSPESLADKTLSRDSAASGVESKTPSCQAEYACADGSATSAINSTISNPDIPYVSTTASLRRNLLRLNTLSEVSQRFSGSSKRHEGVSLLESRPLNTNSFTTGLAEDCGKLPGKRKVSERWNPLSGQKQNSSEEDTFTETIKPSRKDFLLDAYLRPSTNRLKDFALESLSSTEARTMSGLLRQASLEKIGSSNIGSLANSASKSRLGNYYIPENGRISTPENKLMSARLNGDRVRLSPSHRLPPVKAKKKQKRCYVCGKKTGLATSYQCRCGNNFCASHRYAELHDCTFDYKTEGRKLLEQSNPLVTSQKLPKI